MSKRCPFFSKQCRNDLNEIIRAVGQSVYIIPYFVFHSGGLEITFYLLE